MQSLVGLVDPDKRVLGTPIHRCLHNHSAAARIRAINGIRLDDSPLARRTPVLSEIAEGVFRVFVGVLLPDGVLMPEGVGAFQVATLEGGKEFIHCPAVGIVPQVICHPREDERRNDSDDDEIPATAAASLIVLLRIHERHDLSIMEAGALEKVPTNLWRRKVI
jgi:hypothetical protein